LLIMLYAACFKPQIAFIATGVYITIECFIWGFHTWVLAFFIHWNFVAFATFLLARVFKVKNRFVYLGFTILVTSTYGVLTSFIDAVYAAMLTENTFSYAFASIYVSGIYFYIIHVVANAAFNIILFAPMRELIDRLMIKYYGRDVFLKPKKSNAADAPAELALTGKQESDPQGQAPERDEKEEKEEKEDETPPSD